MSARVPALLFLALAASALTAEKLAAAPRYRMVVDAAQAEHGVQTVSLVQNPAIQRGWVALSAVDTAAPKHFHLSEVGQRQVLTGPALIPGQEILRLDAQGEPFYITFDAETIAATARRYALQARHTSTNQDHATALSGNVVEESWIIRDSDRDPAAVLGLTGLPPGTWMLSMHIPDADYWQNEVVSGNKTGFSIEGLFETEQLTLSAVAPAPIPVKNWYQRLTAKLSALAPAKAAELRLALGLEQLTDGRAVQIDDTTGAVTVCTPDGTPGEALPDGEYDLANGGKLVVQGGVRADGDGTAPVANAGAAAPPAPPADAPKADAPAPLAPDATPADIVAAVNQLIASVGGKHEAPKEPDATAPAAPKMGAALHGVQLADLGPKLTELKLDAIDLAEGDKLTYNAVTRRLSDSKNALVESGYFAAADGSYFQVSTSQYIWEIDKQTYDTVYGAKLQAVELAKVKAQLAQEPAAGKVHLHAETTALEATDNSVKTRAQLRLARAEVTR